MLTVSLIEFEYDKTAKSLHGSIILFGGRFPREFEVISHHTGKKTAFHHIGEDHPMFDHDHWDGEQAVYEPAIKTPKVYVLVVSAAH